LTKLASALIKIRTSCSGGVTVQEKHQRNAAAETETVVEWSGRSVSRMIQIESSMASTGCFFNEIVTD